MGKIKVLIIDDSALVRKLLTQILSGTPDIEVVGTAADPYIARNKIKQLNPDVLTLDVEMPRMDGLAFLANLMRLRPMPVVMVSALTEAGADVTLQALEYGAVDYIFKPKLDVADTLQNYADQIIEKIRVASKAQIQPLSHAKITNSTYSNALSPINTLKVEPKYSADVILKNPLRAPRHFKTTDKIIAIGASTGGTEAIKILLSHLPASTYGIVIAQHIPATFSQSFANRMNQSSAMHVYEASDKQVIMAGHVYIAPGGQHLLVERDGAHYSCHLSDGVLVNRHRPSVDVLFRSVAQAAGENALGIILTGMGDDGAHGLKEMHDTGATTIAQDEYTSVVWGMPGEAVKLGGVNHILPLAEIAHFINNWCKQYQN